MEVYVLPVLIDNLLETQWFIEINVDGEKCKIKVDNINMLIFLIYDIIPFIICDKKVIGYDLFDNSYITIQDNNIVIYVKQEENIYKFIINKIKRTEQINVEISPYDGVFRKYKILDNTFIINTILMQQCLLFELDLPPKNICYRCLSYGYVLDLVKEVFSRYYTLSVSKYEQELNVEFGTIIKNKLFINPCPIIINDKVSFANSLFLQSIRYKQFRFNNTAIFYYSKVLMDNYMPFQFFINFIYPCLRLDNVPVSSINEIKYMGTGVHSFGIRIRQLFIKVINLSFLFENEIIDIKKELQINDIIDVNNYTMAPKYYGFMTSNNRINNHDEYVINFRNGLTISLFDIIDLIHTFDTKNVRLSEKQITYFIKQCLRNMLLIFHETADGNLVQFKGKFKDLSYDIGKTLPIILHDIIQSVSKLHLINICHMDIKLDNFVYYIEGNSLRCRIIDFGLSDMIDSRDIYGAYRNDQSPYDFDHLFDSNGLVLFFNSIGLNGTRMRNQLYEWTCIAHVITNLLSISSKDYFRTNEILQCRFIERKSLPHDMIISKDTLISLTNISILIDMVDIIIFLFGFIRKGLGIKEMYENYNQYLDYLISKYNLDKDKIIGTMFDRIIKIMDELFNNIK